MRKRPSPPSSSAATTAGTTPEVFAAAHRLTRHRCGLCRRVDAALVREIDRARRESSLGSVVLSKWLLAEHRVQIDPSMIARHWTAQDDGHHPET